MKTKIIKEIQKRADRSYEHIYAEFFQFEYQYTESYEKYNQKEITLSRNALQQLSKYLINECLDCQNEVEIQKILKEYEEKLNELYAECYKELYSIQNLERKLGKSFYEKNKNIIEEYIEKFPKYRNIEAIFFSLELLRKNIAKIKKYTEIKAIETIEDFIKYNLNEFSKYDSKYLNDPYIRSKIVDNIYYNLINEYPGNLELKELKEEIMLNQYKENQSNEYRHLNCNNNYIYLSNEFDDNACFLKLYLSIKPEYYYEVINTKIIPFLQDLKDKHNKIGQSKFRINTIANDSVVLRFNCIEYFYEFMKFLKANPEIESTFDKENLFIPNINGVMIIEDDGDSYNYFLANIIFDYIMQGIEINKETFILFVESLENQKQYELSTESFKIYQNTLISKIKNQDNLLLEELLGVNNQNNKEKIKK